jgi:hypothetical protein
MIPFYYVVTDIFIITTILDFYFITSNRDIYDNCYRIVMADQKKEVKSFGNETATTDDTKKEEQINNTQLGLQMTGLQTAEGKTVTNTGEYAEAVEAERKKNQEELVKKIKESEKK